MDTSPVLKEFEEKFNSIHPDFRNEPSVKPELSRRAADLEESLWDASDENTDAASESLQFLKKVCFVQKTLLYSYDICVRFYYWI